MRKRLGTITIGIIIVAVIVCYSLFQAVRELISAVAAPATFLSVLVAILSLLYSSRSEEKKSEKKITENEKIEKDTETEISSVPSQISFIPKKDFFMTPSGEPNCVIVYGSQDVDSVAVSILAARVQCMFTETEEYSFPSKSFSFSLRDIPVGRPVVVTPEGLHSLWFHSDQDSRKCSESSDQFRSWKAHEEIQILISSSCDQKEQSEDLFFRGMEGIRQGKAPGLIYRADNIHIPPQLRVQCTVYGQIEVRKSEIPHPLILRNKMLPHFMLLGDFFMAISSGTILDVNIRSGEKGQRTGHPYLIAGEPVLLLHHMIAKDETFSIGGHEILLKDVDIDSKNILLQIICNETCPQEVCLPFSRSYDLAEIPLEQKEVSLSNAVVFQEHEGYWNENSDYYYLFSASLLVVQALDVFHGISGNIKALINVYALKNYQMFYTNEWIPYVLEPDCFGILVDSMRYGESLSFWEKSYGTKLDANSNIEEIPAKFCDNTGLYEINIPLFYTEQLKRSFEGPRSLFRVQVDRFNVQEKSVDITIHQEIGGGTCTKVKSILPEKFDILRSDDEIGSNEKESYNMILIGTPESNIVIRDLIEFRAVPNDGSQVKWAESTQASCKFYRNPFFAEKDVLVISGGIQNERRNIVEELTQELH